MTRSPNTSPQLPKLWLLVSIIGPRGSGVVAGTVRRAPQALQNFAPAGFSCPQAGQLTGLPPIVTASAGVHERVEGRSNWFRPMGVGALVPVQVASQTRPEGGGDRSVRGLARRLAHGQHAAWRLSENPSSSVGFAGATP